MSRIAQGDELVFLPLGGSGEIGMNFNAYGFGPPDDRQWIIVDCGVLFGREGNTPGVDVLMPDVRFLAEQRENVLGIIATHAHEDHIGAIAHLWPSLRCPVYATPFTARLITGKLDEAGLSSKLHVREVPVGGSMTLGPFDIDFISITHSILEPNLLAIRTPLGIVAHTGDWKIDPNPMLGEETDTEALARLGDGGVLALVCDSTNALVPGSSGSEATVREKPHRADRHPDGPCRGDGLRLQCGAAGHHRACGARPWPFHRAGRPLDAEDGLGGARMRLPEGLPPHPG